MRALVQRVVGASVWVEGAEVGRIDSGLVVFIGVGKDDVEEDVDYLVNKIVNLRIFDYEAVGFNISALESKSDLLVISQFTLYSDVRKGRRPSFTHAASAEKAAALFEKAISTFEKTGLLVKTGRFQKRMLVEVHNEGPINIIIDSADRHRSRRS